MAYKTAAEMLQIIKEESPLGLTSMVELRAAFERFYIKHQASQDLRVEEVAVDAVPGFWISAPGSSHDRTVLFFHGGGFTLGSTKDHLGLCGHLSKACGCRVLSLDYRLAPEHPFPAAVNDCTAAYTWLLQSGYESTQLALAGISCGGTLALTTMLGLRERGRPLPTAAVCMSPAVDLLFPGQSVTANQERDWITKARLDSLRANYLGNQDPRQPLASPIMGDLAGLPPILVQAGEGELILDDIARFVRKARDYEVEITFKQYKDMFHAWQVFASQLAEGVQAIREAGNFLKTYLDLPPNPGPRS